MKVAILSTPANFEFARQYIDQARIDDDVTHYFKRGALCQKRSTGGKQSRHKVLGRVALLKDLRAERFDNFILVEWPRARTKVLPFYALLAFLSKARRKSILLENGSMVPFITKIGLQLVGDLMLVAMEFIVVFPLLLLNLVILITIAIGVDLACWPKSKTAAALARDRVDSSAG